MYLSNLYDFAKHFFSPLNIIELHILRISIHYETTYVTLIPDNKLKLIDLLFNNFVF